MGKGRHKKGVDTRPLLTVIIAAAVIALIVLGGGFVGGSGGLSPRAQLAVAEVQVVEATEAAEAARRAYEQAQAERQMQAESTAASVRVTEQARDNERVATSTAVSIAATAAQDAANAIADNNATSTAYPPTATAQAVKDVQDAERVAREGQATVNAWATQGAMVILDATATREAENRAERRENAKVTQGWLIAVLVFLCFASSVASIILIFRIWFIHIKPLKQKLERVGSLADAVPEVCRRLQRLEERTEHAEEQG